MAGTVADIEGLIGTVVKQIVDNPDAVKITADMPEPREVYVEISVEESDIGKVIGRQGRTIKSIRTLSRAVGAQGNLHVEVEIAE